MPVDFKPSKIDFKPKEEEIGLARKIADPIAAFGNKAMDTATFGGSTELLNKYGDKEYNDYLEKNYPIPGIAGSIVGGFGRLNPFGATMGVVEKVASSAGGAVKSITPRVAKIFESLGLKSFPQNFSKPVLEPLTSLAVGTAKLPVVAGAQAGINEGARSAIQGDFSLDGTQNAALKAGMDLPSLAITGGLVGLNNASKGLNLAKGLYARGAPINAKDIERMNARGVDILQEGMDQKITGTASQIKEKSKLAKNRADELRRSIVSEADLSPNKSMVDSKDLRQPLHDKQARILNQMGEEAELYPYQQLSGSMRENLPDQLSPQALEKFLVSQKQYLRDKASEARVANLYAGNPASGPMQARREVISPGLKLQEQQIESSLGGGKGKEFRDLGNKYGIASAIERGAEQEMAKSPGTLRDLGTYGYTKLGSGLNSLQQSQLSPQALMTILRQIAEERRQSGVQQ